VSVTRALSVHAAYGCRERGACCTAGWPIPIEAESWTELRRAMAAGVLAPPGLKPRGSIDAGSVGRWRPGPSGPGMPVLLPIVNNACVFHHETGEARCALHRTLGHAALPLACRQFPRVSVIDPRGVSITLSHYCPTAAALLDTGVPVSIVERPAAFPGDGEYVGLDVQDALPPALRPDMLMDWESWWVLESEAIALIASQRDAQEAITRLFVAVELVRTWSPGAEPLNGRVRAAFDIAGAGPAPVVACRTFAEVAADVIEAVPIDFRGQAEAALACRTSTTAPGAHVAFLAAHTFASWPAHLGDDLRTWWRSIETAHVLISGGLGVRDVDLLLRHLTDPHTLALVWSKAEGIRARTRPAPTPKTQGRPL